MSTNTKLAEALHPFVLANSSEEHITLVVRTADVARARAALAAHDAEQEPVAWRVWRGDSYELFFNEEAAKRRCECFIRKGKPEPLYAAPTEQAAQAVPAGFKWVPVEPTEDMLTAAVREDDKAFVDGMPHGATAADVWAVMLAAAPQAAQPKPPPDTEAVTACWQDFGRTEEFRRAVKWSQDGEIPGALFVAFRAGLRAASPKALCDCGKKAVADCDKWEPGCDLGQSPEHARVVEIDLKPEQAQQSELTSILARLEAVPVAWPSAADIADEIDALLPMSHGDSTRAAIEEWWRQLVKRKLSKIAPPAAEPLTIGASGGEVQK